MNPAASKSLQLSTPTDTTIVLMRTFNAPRRLVWAAITEPAKMRRWMIPPPGMTLTVCECEARVGGPVSLAWRSEDGTQVVTLQGVFTEAVPHERMVHTEVMKLGSGEVIGSQLETHEFEEENGVTVMRITQAFDSKEARDGAIASGMDQGVEACYQKMDAIFAQEGQRPAGAAL